MKYFFDTEFIERGAEHPIDLISIGIVTHDGREFYAINGDCDFSNASDWVKDNVLIHLPPKNHRTWQHPDQEMGKGQYVSRALLKTQITQFCDPERYGKPEFWAYYADYDHVALCQIFGTMMDLPKGFPMYTRDIKQWCDSLGNPQLPPQLKGEHNALDDAKWNREAWQFLQTYSEHFKL